MIFDTGSNWLWVDSEKCSNCPTVPYFNESSSKTYNTEKEFKVLRYGSGSVMGYISKD
jgi:hypothetical protein